MAEKLSVLAARIVASKLRLARRAVPTGGGYVDTIKLDFIDQDGRALFTVNARNLCDEAGRVFEDDLS